MHFWGSKINNFNKQISFIGKNQVGNVVIKKMSMKRNVITRIKKIAQDSMNR